MTQKLYEKKVVEISDQIKALEVQRKNLDLELEREFGFVINGLVVYEVLEAEAIFKHEELKSGKNLWKKYARVLLKPIGTGFDLESREDLVKNTIIGKGLSYIEFIEEFDLNSVEFDPNKSGAATYTVIEYPNVSYEIRDNKILMEYEDCTTRNLCFDENGLIFPDSYNDSGIGYIFIKDMYRENVNLDGLIQSRGSFKYSGKRVYRDFSILFVEKEE